MTYTIIDAEQRSPEWFAARLGRVTASKADELYAAGKGSKEAVGRRDYRMRLALERLNGRAAADNVRQNDDMKRGVELEPEALALYEAVTGAIVSRVGFLAHNELPIGVSPDGMIDGGLGLVEVKAPRAANHYAYIVAGVVPPDYMPQIVHGQFVTGAAYTDFVSYCPDMPPKGQLFVVRHTRDEKQIASYQLMLVQFIAEVDALVESMREAFAEKAVA